MAPLPSGHVRAVSHDDNVTYRRAIGFDRFHQGQKFGIDHHHCVLSVLHGVAHLVDEQARIDRVANGTHACDRVVRFEVAVARPSERRHTFAKLHAQTCERCSQLAAPLVSISVGVPVHLTVGECAHDFDIAVRPRRVLDE